MELVEIQQITGLWNLNGSASTVSIAVAVTYWCHSRHVVNDTVPTTFQPVAWRNQFVRLTTLVTLGRRSA